jgi:hypothetical protein
MKTFLIILIVFLHPIRNSLMAKISETSFSKSDHKFYERNNKKSFSSLSPTISDCQCDCKCLYRNNDRKLVTNAPHSKHPLRATPKLEIKGFVDSFNGNSNYWALKR